MASCSSVFFRADARLIPYSVSEVLQMLCRGDQECRGSVLSRNHFLKSAVLIEGVLFALSFFFSDKGNSGHHG